MWTWMGPTTKATVLLMGFMLLCAIYAFLKHIEQRHVAMIAAASIVGTLRQQHPLSESIVEIQNIDDHLSSPVVRAGFEAFEAAPDTLSDVHAIELAEHAMERRERVAHLHARRGLILLDTVAHAAPLVGFSAVMLAITNIFRGTAESVAEYLTFVVNSLAHALVLALVGLAVAVLAALFHSYTSRGIEKVDALNGALIQRVREYLRTQPRTTGVEELFPAEAVVTKMPHYGNRFVLCAGWLWWLYLAGLLVFGAFAR
jgi:biopolymer transport protein ExbB/TolQ